MHNSSYIDLSYLIENSCNDALFIKEILQTTQLEFHKLLKMLKEINSSDQFSSEEMYAVLHKYKPTAAMYAIETYPIFELYGSGNNKIEFHDFISIKKSLINNLEEVLQAIELELLKY